MEEEIYELTNQEEAGLQQMRDWLRAHFKEGSRGQYDTVPGKLAVVDAILRQGLFDRNSPWQLQALGLGFGDAVSQQLGMKWAIVADRYGRTPAVILPKTTLKVFALTTIQKRIDNDEPVEVIALFDAFCGHIDKIRKPKSILQRLFGPRLK